MKLQTHVIPFVPILASAAHGLQFTGPDTNTDLDLSAPITVSWEPDAAEAAAGWTVIDLSWHGELVRGSSCSYTLEENMTVSTGGRYEWNPAPVREALLRGDRQALVGQGVLLRGQASRAGCDILGERDTELNLTDRRAREQT